jgi:NAD+ synthase
MNAKKLKSMRNYFGRTFKVTSDNVAEYWRQLVECSKRYMKDSGGRYIVLGLSGGIDSAVAARLAVETGYPLRAYLLPNGDINDNSVVDAMKMVMKFNMDYEIIDIGPIVEAEIAVLKATAAWSEASDNDRHMTLLNVPARVRGNVLWSMTTLNGGRLWGTDNMAEGITGYYTLGGDDQYSFNPLFPFAKGGVRMFARLSGVVEEIIIKTPTADLTPGQTDEGELGFTYSEIDDFINFGTCGDPEIDKKIERRYDFTEFKRHGHYVVKGDENGQLYVA